MLLSSETVKQGIFKLVLYGDLVYEFKWIISSSIQKDKQALKKWAITWIQLDSVHAIVINPTTTMGQTTNSMATLT